LATSAAVVAVFGLGRPYLAECAAHSAELARDVDPATELQSCQTAVALAPGYALGWTRLAAATRSAAAREPSPADRLRWLRQAREAMDRAVALVPADPANHANRGRILAALTAAGEDNADAALAEFDVAIALSPQNLLFRADAGQTAIDCHRLARARQYFEAGQAVDPDYARFAAGFGAVELAEGHPDKALVWLERSHALLWYGDHPGFDRHFTQLAAAHLAARHAAAAERWARTALSYHPEEAVPHWVLAGALELEGHRAEAAAEYRTVLGIAPGWGPAREALRRLGGALP
jgi:Tfp pilus assembly protein PilF